MASIATFLRVEDGKLQTCALAPNLRGCPGWFYETLDCLVRPIWSTAPWDNRHPGVGVARELTNVPGERVISLAEIAADVLVFINRPLESVNHFFFEALAKQAMRQDCGLVTGIAVDSSGKITRSGFRRGADGTIADRLAGCMFSDFIGMAEADDVVAVDSISDEFFAIRPQLLKAVGGLAAVSSARMPLLTRRLIANAGDRGLRILVTPFAVATIEIVPNRSRLLELEYSSQEGAGSVQLDDTASSTAGQSAQVNRGYTTWKYVIPLPPDEMMGNVGAPSIENFLVVADAWSQIVTHYTPENATVMDIGCGCGRIARVLVNNRSIRRYIGFDVMREHVRWCRHFIRPFGSQLVEFHLFDLYSEEYNPDGDLKAEELTFPAEDKSVHVIFAASVFTHLLEADAVHYLREIRRVLRPDGVALLSIHENVAAGQRFSGTERRIDIDPAYFAELATGVGLHERESRHEFCGQLLFSLQPSL